MVKIKNTWLFTQDHSVAANWKVFGNWNNLLLMYFFCLGTGTESNTQAYHGQRFRPILLIYLGCIMEMKNQSLTVCLTRILVHVPMMKLLVLYVLKVSCMHAALAK